MEMVILWILFGIFAATIAASKHRSTIGWFLCGLLFGPFGLLVSVLPDRKDAE